MTLRIIHKCSRIPLNVRVKLTIQRPGERPASVFGRFRGVRGGQLYIIPKHHRSEMGWDLNVVTDIEEEKR
jgi:hypothetical protein